MKNKDKLKILTINNLMILDNVRVADNYFARLKGLLGKGEIKDSEGLLIRPCNSIHTFFMKFNIDVAFIDNDFRVVAIYIDMPPWRISKVFKEASFVIEGKPETFAKIKIGDQIKIVT